MLQQVTIVKNGEAKAKIVVQQGANEQIRTAAKTLADYIEKASGARLPLLLDENVSGSKASVIQVGETKSVGKGILPKGLDDDGFVIRNKMNRIVILGPTDWGTQFGVYHFLEKYLGVRWLLPGPNGDHVPHSVTIEIPAGRTVVQEPISFSRWLDGLNGNYDTTDQENPWTEWARFNRMRLRVPNFHNLRNLFPPKIYLHGTVDPHPDFYPMMANGKRYEPDCDDYDWQPCFSNEETISEAIKNITNYFNTNPEENFYSLAINDSWRFCLCRNCQSQTSGKKNAFGLDDYSDLYYHWCNQVIDGVLKNKNHQDKWFCCLAYNQVAAPPEKITVHNRLIPYMTDQRHRWINNEDKTRGQGLTRAWHEAFSKKSPALGWYDYIYGTPYCLPRVYFHLSHDYLSFGSNLGVKVNCAELYPNWGEGPKPYVFAKLWWNPNQNVDDLLTDWYEACVGSEAARSLAKYYQIWETFWTEDILSSMWFNDISLGNFENPDYLAQVKKEYIYRSRRLLNKCIENCTTRKQRARAEIIEKAFQYYEASALSYIANIDLAQDPVNTESDAEDILNKSIITLDWADKRQNLVKGYRDELRHPWLMGNFPKLAGDTWGSYGIWAAIEWVKKSRKVRQRVEGMATESWNPLVKASASRLLAIVDAPEKNLIRNPSFEAVSDTNEFNDWDFLGEKTEQMFRTDEVAHAPTYKPDDHYSVLCNGVERGDIKQTIDSPKSPKPGRYCCLAWIYAPIGQKSKGTAQLWLILQNNNVDCYLYRAWLIPPPGKWTLLVIDADIPPKNMSAEEITGINVILTAEGFQDSGKIIPDAGKVYWDDVGLYRVDARR